MLFHMYQVFSSLQGHPHFFVHFSFTFMEYFFIDHHIPFRLLLAISKPFKLQRWDCNRVVDFLTKIILLFLFFSLAALEGEVS